MDVSTLRTVLWSWVDNGRMGKPGGERKSGGRAPCPADTQPWGDQQDQHSGTIASASLGDAIRKGKDASKLQLASVKTKCQVSEPPSQLPVCWVAPVLWVGRRNDAGASRDRGFVTQAARWPHLLGLPFFVSVRRGKREN